METISAAISRDELVQQARSNPNYLAMLCIPEIFRFFYPNEYLVIWQLFVAGLKKQIEYLAIGLPRGFSKTVFLKIFVIWCILFSDRRFIVIVCNTQTLANNFIADIEHILNSLNIISIFGRWNMNAEVERQDLKKFTFCGRDIVLAALGAGASLRGLNIRFIRPDMILCDDLQSREQAKSDIESKAMLEWFQATLVKARSYERCLIIFVGNMYPYEYALLKMLKKNPVWKTFITAGILSDGESLWPQLRPLQSLLDELASDIAMGTPEVFHAEVMNDEEAGSKSGVDFTKMNVLKLDQMYQPQAGFILIDPSAGKKKSDDVAIGACFVSEQEPCLFDLKVGRFNPGQQVRTAIELAVKHRIQVIIVEGVAYQSTLAYWINLYATQLGLTSLIILEITPEGEAKTSRIMNMFKELTAQKPGERVWVHPELKSLVTNQIVFFDPLKTRNKDDILDIMAYMRKVVAMYGPAILLPLEMMTEQKIEASFGETLAIAF